MGNDNINKFYILLIKYLLKKTHLIYESLKFQYCVYWLVTVRNYINMRYTIKIFINYFERDNLKINFQKCTEKF